MKIHSADRLRRGLVVNFILLASVFGLLSCTRGHGNDAATPAMELPFELIGGRIYLPATVNGHNVTAIIDTGAAATVIDLPLAEQWDLPSLGTVSANGPGGSSVPARILRSTTVRIGNAEARVEYAVPLGSMGRLEGRPLEVVVGTAFFAKHVIEIDYSRRVLRIVAAHQAAPQEVTLPFRLERGLPHVQVELVAAGKTYRLDAMADTGASATTLTGRFLRDHQLDVPMTAKTVTGEGVGGTTQGRYMRADILRVGGVELRQPVLTASDEQSGGDGVESDRDIVLGSSILERFRVVLDYRAERIILIPGDATSRAFEADKSGMRIVAEGPAFKVFRVAGVLENSSASAAGIQTGDVIDALDGISAGQYRLWELRELFRKSPAAGAWRLRIRRGAVLLQVTLPAKSII